MFSLKSTAPDPTKLPAGFSPTPASCLSAATDDQKWLLSNVLPRVNNGEAEVWLMRLPRELDVQHLEGIKLRIDDAPDAPSGPAAPLGSIQALHDEEETTEGDTASAGTLVDYTVTQTSAADGWEIDSLDLLLPKLVDSPSGAAADSSLMFVKGIKPTRHIVIARRPGDQSKTRADAEGLRRDFPHEATNAPYLQLADMHGKFLPAGAIITEEAIQQLADAKKRQAESSAPATSDSTDRSEKKKRKTEDKSESKKDKSEDKKSAKAAKKAAKASKSK